MNITVEDKISEVLEQFKKSPSFGKQKQKPVTGNAPALIAKGIFESAERLASMQLQKNKMGECFITGQGENNSVQFLLFQNCLGEIFFAGSVNCVFKVRK